MSDVRYNMIGPVDVPEDTSAGLVLLPTNNTLIAMPLKGKDAPRKPEEIPAEHSGSVEDLMEYLQPEVKVGMKTGDESNPETNETLKFRGGVTAFSPDSIKNQSPTLRRLNAEFETSDALVSRIDQNAQFRKALDDAKAREAIIVALTQVVEELQASLSDED